VGFPGNGGFKVGLGVPDKPRAAKVGIGMNRFGGGGGAEKLGDLGQAFLVGLLGEGEIFAVGLGFAGKKY